MARSCLLVSLLVAILLAVPASAATTVEIDASLKKAVDWLYKQQKNGNWEEAQAPIPVKDAPSRQDPKGGQFTGRTALAVLALLNSGEKANDPRIVEAVKFLQKTPTEGVYALGLRCQVWLLLPRSKEIETAMQRDAKILLTTFKQTGNAKGMYDYAPSSSNEYSHSRSQYAVLGVWAAAQMGLEIQDQYWTLVEDAWKRNQDPSGGWSYKHPKESGDIVPTPGMTTVGVASLFITQEYLRAVEGVTCRGNQSNPAIEKGIKWLSENMDKFATGKTYARGFPYPTLYAYERVGAASGLRYFGTVDWYERGADWAVKKQQANGTWAAAEGHFDDHVNTCFAMLFLAKGRAPIVISKLQYVDAAGKEGRWNQRSRDVANVTRWIGRLIERELAFQVVNLDVDLEDITEAPILYVAGNEPLNLSDKHKQKLKAYLEAGGMLVANADCAQPAFTASVKKLAGELFPDYEFAMMKDDDLVYTNYYPRSKWKTKPQIEALSNGARKMVFLFSFDPGKAWQVQDSKSKVEQFELMADVLLYAVDNTGLRYRGERYFQPDDPKAKPSQTITVARLKYPAIWDPEPGGWRQLSNVMTTRESVAVKTKVVELGKDELKDVKIAHLTGTAGAKLTDAQRDQIKKFVEGGGTLIVDVAGGVSSFAQSAEEELAAMFPGNKPEMLPKDHPLYSAGGGTDPEYSYRGFARRQIGKVSGPRLQGITLNGRLAVIYSREDLSCGLVGQQVDGIVGYTPESATNLMVRILNNSAGIKSAATRPAEPKKDEKKPDEKKPEPKKDDAKKKDDKKPEGKK